LRSSHQSSVVRLRVGAAQEPQVYYVSEHKLISGNPKQQVWVEYESPDREFCAGVWASEVGEWKVQYTEQEYCCILEGRCVLTHEDGTAQEFSAGMEFIVPRGFVGRWRVVEPTRKRFVIYEAQHTEQRPPSDA
jgi:uncharacterized cupin superfamily protein